MKTNKIISGIVAACFLAGTVLAPTAAIAGQSSRQQKNKNQWRNIGYGAGAVGLYGLLKHDNTLAILGGAGALYSASRYEHDRKSQSQTDRARASYFNRSTYSHNGHTYHRRTVTRNGHKYYQFAR
jgi:hypothetical protein